MYLPVPLKDNVYQSNDTSPSVIITGRHIDSSDVAGLIGTWEGVLDGVDVILTLFDDGGSMVFSILSLTETDLVVVDKRDKNHTACILTRKEQ